MATATKALRAWVLAACVLGSSAYAERIELGGYAGGTSTTMHTSFDCGTPTDPNDICVTGGSPHRGAQGASVGGYVRYPVMKPVLVEANLMYAQKGYDVAPEVRIHYLEVPIVARVDPFGAWAQARPFAYAGLAPAILLSCHESGTRFDNDTDMAVPYSDACGSWPFDPQAPNRFDLGLVAGVGMGWEFGFGVVELHARFNEGLIDNASTSIGGTTVNRAFYLLAGIGGAIGKR